MTNLDTDQITFQVQGRAVNAQINDLTIAEFMCPLSEKTPHLYLSLSLSLSLLVACYGKQLGSRISTAVLFENECLGRQ